MRAHLDENPYECASRELEEETGYTAMKYMPPIEMYILPGYSTEKMSIFIAMNLVHGKFHPNESEAIQVEKLPLRKVIHMIGSNEIYNVKTIASIFYYM